MHILHTFSRRIIVCLGIVLCPILTITPVFGATCYANKNTTATQCRAAKGGDCIGVANNGGAQQATDATNTDSRCTSWCYDTTQTTVRGGTVASYTIYCGACSSQYDLVYGGGGCYITENVSKYCENGTTTSSSNGCYKTTITPKQVSSTYDSIKNQNIEWGEPTSANGASIYFQGTLSQMCAKYGNTPKYSCNTECYGTTSNGTSGCNTCPSNATCNGTNSFSCAKGYYKNSSSCDPCPSYYGVPGTTESAGATSITKCIIEGVNGGTDLKGTYNIQTTCPYCSNLCSSKSDCLSLGTDYICQDGCCKKDTSISCEHGECSSDIQCPLGYPSCFKGCCRAHTIIDTSCIEDASCRSNSDCGLDGRCVQATGTCRCNLLN